MARKDLSLWSINSREPVQCEPGWALKRVLLKVLPRCSIRR